MKKILTAFLMLVTLALSIGAFASDSDVLTPNISVSSSKGYAYFTLVSDTEDAYIYYTTNGSSPTTSSKRYTSKVKVTETCEVRAVAYDRVNKEYSDEGYYLVTVQKERAGSPTFKSTDVAGGKKITITSSTSGATIYYTLDGTTPTTSSKKYTSSGITVTKDTVIKALAYKSGTEKSKVVTANVYIPELAAPKITVSSSTQKVTITSSTSGATIYYTTNGTTPTTSSKKYSSAFTLTSGATIKAIAVKNGYKTSDVSEKEVEGAKLANPTAAKTGVAGGYKVTLSSTSGATIYYTLDGTNPTTSSKKYTSSGISITKAGTTEIRAMAYKSGSNKSNTVTYNITLSRTAAPKITTSETSSGTKVTMSASSGATIYYTTNGTTPTTSSKKYSSAFTLTSSGTINAIAVRSGYATSEVTEEEIRSSAAAPKATKTAVAGGYNIKLTTTTSGATIYYTTDGTSPTTSSKKYTSSGINVTTSGTTYIRAVSYKSGSYSEESEFDITVSRLATPTISASTASNGRKISITGPSGATIYYTTNGTTPTTSSKKYTSAFTVTASCTIKAIAVKNGYANSAVRAGTLEIDKQVENPSATPKAYSTYTSVTFKCATSGAKIYYTTDGRDPATYGTAVSSGTTVKITESCLLRYVAKKSGYNNSATVRMNVNVAGDNVTILGIDEEPSDEEFYGEIEADGEIVLDDGMDYYADDEIFYDTEELIADGI